MIVQTGNAQDFTNTIFSCIQQKSRENDYRDEEGYLVCGVCHKRREKELNLGGIIGMRIVPIICDCDKKRLEQEEGEKRNAHEIAMCREMLKYSIVDGRFKESTFSAFLENTSNGNALKIAKNYAEHFSELYEKNRGLLLWGEPSTGKTFLACCIANALLEKHVPLIVTSIIKLTGFSSPFSKEAEIREEFIQNMNAAKLLILDDLGAERDTDYKMEQVFEIIDSRYNAKRPMIITTNLSLRQMQNEPDMRKRRIYERILEVCFPVRFMGESWRVKAASSNYNEIRDILLGGKE